MISEQELQEERRQTADTMKEHLQEIAQLRTENKLLRELAERAVVALHMFRHGGLTKPDFNNCREGLCKDWHESIGGRL